MLIDLVGDWRVSLIRTTNRYILLSSLMDEKRSRNSRYTNWEGYKADLETILKKAPSRFHTLNNLEVAVQFTSDAIIVAFEANCPLKPKNTLTRISWSKKLPECKSERRKLFNRAKRTKASANWKSFRSSQNDNKAIVIAKRKKLKEILRRC